MNRFAFIAAALNFVTMGTMKEKRSTLVVENLIHNYNSDLFLFPHKADARDLDSIKRWMICIILSVIFLYFQGTDSYA